MMTFKQFLLEGGVAGHMAHPFDLPNVNTGKDLLNFFNKAVTSLSKKPAAVKIDGINASIKLVTNTEGNKEFALDRGSNKIEDVEGVTINRLSQRFPQGHGMLEIGKTVLGIFNSSIPNIEKELKKLKLWNSPNILFNMEYVKGSTNVIGYVNNFLVIHGLNEIFQVKSPVRGSTSRASKEVSFDKEALISLIEKTNPIAKKQGFDIEHEFNIDLKEKIDFTGALNSNFSVNYDSKNFISKPLKEWLAKAKNPRAEKIKLLSGKTISAMSLENFKNVSSGVPMDHYIGDNSQNIEKAINGAVFYQATILLGDAIKNAASSVLGSLTTQEGIVIRDPSISSNPVKITGSFITGKEGSKFRKQENEEGVNGLLSNVARVNSTNNYQTNPPFGKVGSKLTQTPGVQL